MLELNNHQQLAQFSLDDIELANPVEITKTSSRYPLHATVRVERSALARAYGRGYWPAMLAALDRCEMLARWIREDGTIVPPLKFIPLAEQSGRIRAMSCQILAIALKELNAHLRQNKEFKLSFNVVPSHLMSEHSRRGYRAR